MKTPIVFITLLLVLVSCDKDAKIAYKFAGTWDIQSIETKYYSNRGTVTDSSRTQTNPGTLVLFNSTDNTLAIQYQYCRVTLPNEVPPSIQDFASRANLSTPLFECMYFAGPHSEDRLTIWKEMEPVGHEYQMYTVTKLTRKKMSLTFTQVDADGYPVYQEAWELKLVDP